MSNSHYLFVCGGLMHGEKLASLLAGANFVGGATAPGKLLERSGEVCMVSGGDERVFGELYLVPDADLARLDEVEAPRYTRERLRVRAGIDGPELAAWSYSTTDIAGRTPLPDGRWAAAGHKWRGGTSWYFAYASNMWRMAERRKLDVVSSVRGRVDNYKIANVADAGDGKNAYGNILPRRGDAVEGVLFRLWQEQVQGDFDVQETVGIKMARRTFVSHAWPASLDT